MEREGSERVAARTRKIRKKPAREAARDRAELLEPRRTAEHGEAVTREGVQRCSGVS